jgi:hypothetical protein
MVSSQHRNWINAGRPDSGLARPLQQLANVLSVAGYTVYTYPNDEHLDDQPPQDHTYYSETGWPGTSPKWWRHAIDIMPPTKPGLPSLTRLGDRIVSDRNAGRITWLKYINWPSTGSLSEAVQDGWKPSHYRRSSSDTGHIHISCITGVENLDAPYNPLLAGEVSAMSRTVDEVYDLVARTINGQPLPAKDAPSAIPEWIDLIKSNGTKLDDALKILKGLQADVADLKVRVGAVADVSVTGMLHLGQTS